MPDLLPLMRRRLGLGSLAVATALVVSACGSSSSAPAGTKADAAFIAKADEACAAANALGAPGTFPVTNFNDLNPTPTQLPAVGAYFETHSAPDYRALPAKLAALGEPSTDASGWNQVRALASQISNTALTQFADARQANVTGFVATVHKLTTLGTAFDTAAKSAGFSSSGACVSDFG
jgi:hypothetical protein